MAKQQPQWQPISKLSLIAKHIDGMLESAQEQYQTLLPAKSKPHVLDDYTVNLVREVFANHQEDLWLLEKQLVRWSTGKLTGEQQTEIEQLASQMKKLREQITIILA